MKVTIDGLTLTLASDRRALAGLSLTVEDGERVAIIGPSGAGKTSLLRVIATSIGPTSGSIRLDGADPWGLSRAALRQLRARIGLIHQAPPLPPRQRVVTAVLAGRLGAWPLWKCVASLLYPLDIPGARDTLTRLEVADRLFDRCGRLSGGQLQRVGVARVLYQRPQLMLADEPVSALDPQLADRVIGELNREATLRDVTLIASLHAVDLALTWFPRIVGVRNGTIAFDLPRAKVTTALLTDLYASESPVPPTQDNRLIELPERGVKPHPIYR